MPGKGQGTGWGEPAAAPGGAAGRGGAGSGSSRTEIAVLGATGVVGQRLVQLLDRHPLFRLAELVASGRRAGHRYGEAVKWSIRGDPPAGAAGLVLGEARGLPARPEARTPGQGPSLRDLVRQGPAPSLRSPVVLSALPSGVAAETEVALAGAGHVVCTNASPHRMRPDTPLIVPEVNPGAIEQVAAQPWRDQGGALVANPNCVVVGLALACAPIERAFGIEAATVVTLQAISGAGLTGLGAVEVAGNVIPAIEGEEEKIGPELNKILGARIEVSVAVNRVPVLDGHTAHVFLRLGNRASPGDVARVLEDFSPPAAARALPTLPARPLVLRPEPDRPQPRLDADAAGGMAVSIGRIRAAPPPHDIAFAVVAHNGIRGAAGACLANAELYASHHNLHAQTRRTGGAVKRAQPAGGQRT